MANIENNVKIKEKTAQELKEDFIANRMLILMIISTVAIVAMLLVKKYNEYCEATFITDILPWATIGIGVCVVALVVNQILMRKKGVDDSGKYFSNGILLGIFAVILGILLAFKYILITGSVAAIVVAVISYFIFCCYPIDFFFCTLMVIYGSVFTYLSTFNTDTTTLKNILKLACKGAAVVIPLAVIIFMLILRNNVGYIGKKRIMKKNNLYFPLIVTSAVAIASAVCVMFVPSMLVYCMAALIADFLAFAVVYTIRMM